MQKMGHFVSEINVDSSLTQNFEDAIPYMECLIKIKKQHAVSNKNYFDSCTLSISNIKEGSLEKRFQLLAHPSKQPRRFSGIFRLISIFVFLSSYFVTWEESTLISRRLLTCLFKIYFNGFHQYTINNS